MSGSAVQSLRPVLLRIGDRESAATVVTAGDGVRRLVASGEVSNDTDLPLTVHIRAVTGG